MADEEPETTTAVQAGDTPTPRRRERLSAEEREAAKERLLALMPDAEPVPEEELNDLYFNQRD